MIFALIAVGIGGLFVGVYVGGAGMAIMSARRIGLMQKVIRRQAAELVDAHADRARWQQAAIIAECEQDLAAS